MRYTPERKEAVLRKMMPPHARPISQLAVEEGISEATLYKWRQEAGARLEPVCRVVGICSRTYQR